MIVTLTVNPSLDRTVALAQSLERGAVQRVDASHEEPGGKGVNVTRALAAAGADSIAVLPAGHDDPFIAALHAAHVPAAVVPIAGRLRSNLSLTEPDGTTTKLNEPGPVLSVAEQHELVDEVVRQATDASWLVLAGSLAPGLGDDFYVRVIRAVRRARLDCRIAVDTSGAPLAALLDTGEPVDLVKPNGEELAELARVPAEHLETDPDRVALLAAGLVPRGIHAALVTLGATGAVLVAGDGAWFAPAPRIVPRSTVGAGDSSLAGYLLALTEGAEAGAALAQAVAHGAAAASLPGSAVPSRGLADPSAIVVTPIGDVAIPIVP